jgi:hypothetical protein
MLLQAQNKFLCRIKEVKQVEKIASNYQQDKMKLKRMKKMNIIR